jgi:hypothetical protein
LRQALLGELKERGMSIKVGDKIRYSVTEEEGAVVAMSNNTSCGRSGSVTHLRT